jgi:hypothetical protein
MARRAGWKALPLDVPEFVHELFEKLRDEYGDLHGVVPSQPQTFSALVYAADTKSLEKALKAYRDETKRRAAAETAERTG